jgi:hypothetical protein
MAWQFLYRTYLVVPYLNGSPPRWLQSVHWWLPDVLSLRILRAAGLPIEFARVHGDTPLVFASVAIEVLIWAALFFLLALCLANLKRAEQRVAVA